MSASHAWRSELSIGVPEIDAEHEKLLDLFDAFRDALERGSGEVVLHNTLERMIAYTAYHFRHEESLFEGTAYPGLAAHKAEHAAMAARVLDIQGKMRFGSSRALAQELDRLLDDWIVNHVMNVDKDLAAFLRQGA